MIGLLLAKTVKNEEKRIVMQITKRLLLFPLLLLLASCEAPKKEITVIVREAGSGTREAFDRTVTDGTHFLEEVGENGKKQYLTSVYAVVQTKTGNVLSSVATDPFAIGYVSLGSVHDRVRVLPINGHLPTEDAVQSGDYPLSRPFVVMHTERTAPLSPLAADFLRYLKSDAMKQHAEDSDAVFLTNPVQRANPDEAPIPVSHFDASTSIPQGEKLQIRGSSSAERLILFACRGYADLYGADPSSLFDIQLEGSSAGQRAVREDFSGNVIGFSSAAVREDGIACFTPVLDALAVIVHRDNVLSSVTLADLFSIFSGRVRFFEQLIEENAP